MAATTPASLTDYDADYNGLIDITTLAQLDAIRYDLDGNGAVVTANEANYGAAFPAMTGGSTYAAIICGDGSRISTCSGYELMNNLDFNDKNNDGTLDDPSKWSSDCTSGCLKADGTEDGTTATVGWVPIGDGGPSALPTATDDNLFTATFEGNRKKISNLYINISTIEYVGLFGGVGRGGEIHNLGIEGGSVTETMAYARVGGLVGYNSIGTISACYSTGSATGGSSANVGGLVGSNGGTISACYATGNVTGGAHANVGGLVGNSINSGSTITACYATGNVTGESGYVGGLVGNTLNGGSTIACYATGSATGGSAASVGGLVGLLGGGAISACYSTGAISLVGIRGGFIGTFFGGSASGYFDVTTSGISKAVGVAFGTSIAGIEAKTTAQLQYPTAYADEDAAGSTSIIYSAWDVDLDGNGDNDDPWYFGTDKLYPKLKANFDGNGTASAAEFGQQRFYFANTDGEEVLLPFSVSKYATEGTRIGHVKALTIPGETNPPVFSLAEVDANFEINSSTGEITVKPGANLNPAVALGPLVLPIVATVGSSFTANLSLNIELNNGGAPTFDEDSYVLGALTGSPSKRVVGTTRATDVESSTLTYVLSGGDHANFSISNMGEITVADGVTLSTDVMDTYRFMVTATDADSNSETVGVEVRLFDRSANVGNPKLIDITTLDQLDAIRYDLDGDGLVTDDVNTAAINEATVYNGLFSAAQLACRNDEDVVTFVCEGYELRNDLDFNDADGDGVGTLLSRWAKGAEAADADAVEGTAVVGGWVPIGDNSTDGATSRFITTFDGNRHTIFNLYINRSALKYVGLFGYVGAISHDSATPDDNQVGEIRKLGMEGGIVRGTMDAAKVGGLVGFGSSGKITACYSTGSVEGGVRSKVGGLVGESRVGNTDFIGGRHVPIGGTISASYATGSVTGGSDSNVGGLVGRNNSGAITACYSTGSVTGGSDSNVGGLVGQNFGSGAMISACYSTGSVSGLVGLGNSGTITACYATGSVTGRNINFSKITASYFDTTTSGRRGSRGKTAAQLQYPTDYPEDDAASGGTPIYSAWNVDIDNDGNVDDPWHFGANNRYPKLKVDFDGSGTATMTEFGRQRLYFTNAADVEVFSFSVGESATSGTEIGSVQLLSGLVMNSASLSGTGSSDFMISAMGQITVSPGVTLSLTSPNYRLSVVVTYETDKTLSAAVNITVVDDVPPSFTPGGPFTFEVVDGSAEAASGAEVGTAITATDNTSSPLTYSLTGDGNADFTIDAMGQITVSPSVTLSFATRFMYMLRVVVADRAGNTATADVNITVLDETPPSFTFSAGESSFAFEVAENILAGAEVGTIDATDNGGGTLTYSLTGDGNTDFTINAMGQITVSSGSTLSFATKPSYMLSVTVTDGAGNTATADVNITVTVSDTTPPSFTSGGPFTFEVVDGSAGAASGAVIGTAITATDNTSSPLTYSLTGDGHADFRIDGTGQITVSSSVTLSFAARPTYMLSVVVADRAGNTATADVNITVLDETPPSFTSGGPFTFEVADGSVAGAVVGTIVATDNGGALTYSLTGDGHADFTIDAMGQITVSSGVSLSQCDVGPRIDLMVRATDAAMNEASAAVTIIVISGLPPSFTFPSGASSFAFKVAENALPAGVVGIITATGDVLTYSLSGRRIILTLR